MPEVQQNPIEFELEDGSKVKAATIEEAFKIVAKMKTDTSAALRTEKQERENLAAQLAAQQTEIQRLRTPPPTNGNGFSSEKYWQMMNQDPMAAQDYLDAHRFGIEDPSQVRQTFTSLRSEVSDIKQQALAGQFLAQHAEDFPADKVAAAKLREHTERLTNSGYPFTLETLNLAYAQAIQAGDIKPNEKEEEREEPPAPPANLGAGAGTLPSDVQNAENLDDKALEALLREKGLLR